MKLTRSYKQMYVPRGMVVTYWKHFKIKSHIQK